MRTAIFDIDNCIADDSHRLHLINRDHPNIDERYRAYHEQGHLDKACNRKAVIEHAVGGDKIAFVTGRPELYRLQTWNWLNENFDLPEDTQLLMRPNNDHCPSCELKPRIVALYLRVENVIFAYDDLPDVLEAYVRIGIPNVKRLCINERVAPTVPDLLRQAAKTFEERNALYGDSYKSYGKVMTALFPNGLELDTVDEFNRFGLLSMIVSKLTRYAANMEDGGHQDSAHDLTVYASMLEELTK